MRCVSGAPNYRRLQHAGAVAAAAASAASQRSVFGIIRRQLVRKYVRSHSRPASALLLRPEGGVYELATSSHATDRRPSRSARCLNRPSEHAHTVPVLPGSVVYLDQLFLNSTRQLARSPVKDYYKFTFVREPLERLISAYRDKMFRDAWFVPIRRYIIRKFRRHPSPRCIDTLLHSTSVWRFMQSPYALV